MIFPQAIWAKAPPQPAILPGEIHVWRASLEDVTRIPECHALLSRDELIRAERFAFEVDRQQYILSHGALRTVLSRYTFIDPRALEFTQGPHGKPMLVQSFSDIRFNLSHSAAIALIAVTRGREVGVDVERVDNTIQFEDIAEHYFEPREVWDLRIAPTGERVGRFFDIWTRKEASLKASGVGIAGDEDASGRFAARNFAPAAGYAGAVASEGEDWRLACWDV
jgi:4'-phosphopantetheinyl transferase